MFMSELKMVFLFSALNAIVRQCATDMNLLNDHGGMLIAWVYRAMFTADVLAPNVINAVFGKLWHHLHGSTAATQTRLKILPLLPWSMLRAVMRPRFLNAVKRSCYLFPKNNKRKILTYSHDRLTNAVFDGINFIFQATKRRTRYVTTFEYFTAMVCLSSDKMVLQLWFASGFESTKLVFLVFSTKNPHNHHLIIIWITKNI